MMAGVWTPGLRTVPVPALEVIFPVFRDGSVATIRMELLFRMGYPEPAHRIRVGRRWVKAPAAHANGVCLHYLAIGLLMSSVL